MDVKKSLIATLSLVAITAVADPAPVADLSRSSNQVFAGQSARPGSVEERLSALERVVEARASAQLSLQQQLATLLDEVSELRGATEMHAYKLEEILQQQRDIYQEIDRRMGGQTAGTASQSAVSTEPAATATVPAGNPAAVVAADQLAATEAAAAQAASASTAGMSEAQVYEQALNYVIKDKNYAASIPAFEAFIASYPKSSYRANSHYWLGQLYYQKNELAKSKSNFEVVVKQFPNNSKVPDVLEKLGLVSEKQNDAAAAKKYYNQLVKSFPKSKAAARARIKLESF